MSQTARGDLKLKIGERVCKVRPSLNLIAELEDEFNGLLSFAHRLQDGEWKMMEVVSFLNMLLDAAGKKEEKDALAEEILEKGVIHYIEPIITFLTFVLSGHMMATQEQSSGDNAMGEDQARNAGL